MSDSKIWLSGFKNLFLFLYWQKLLILPQLLSHWKLKPLWLWTDYFHCCSYRMGLGSDKETRKSPFVAAQRLNCGPKLSFPLSFLTLPAEWNSLCRWCRAFLKCGWRTAGGGSTGTIRDTQGDGRILDKAECTFTSEPALSCLTLGGTQ